MIFKDFSQQKKLTFKVTIFLMHLNCDIVDTSVGTQNRIIHIFLMYLKPHP